MNTQVKAYEAKRVRIYVTEDDRVGKSPAVDSIAALLRLNHAAGVTVTRALEGFGASGRPHSAHPDVSWDLPVVIEWVDRSERVDEILPELKRLVPPGLITVDPTEVVHFAHPTVRPVSDAVPVGAVMTRNVATVEKNTPVREVVELMRSRSLRGVPVVDSGTVVGIITNSDVVRRAKLGVRITLLPGLPAVEQERRLEELPYRVASEIMTAPAIKVPINYPLSEAAVIMVQRRLKRLPVVDDDGKLVGIVSRLDLLQTVADFGEKKAAARAPIPVREDAPLSTVMRDDMPTVTPDASLNEVVQAVTATRLNRTLVVDADPPGALSNRRFPWLSMRRIDLEMIPTMAIRVAYTGELGWELHHPVEMQNRLFDRLMEAGEPAGLRLVGARAQNWLRQ
ncbi:MAG: DUF190 domain-containing protein, partial [Myxococcota bacterium]